MDYNSVGVPIGGPPTKGPARNALAFCVHVGCLDQMLCTIRGDRGPVDKARVITD